MNQKKNYNHLMSGVSYFLSFVAGSGITLVCAYPFDFQNTNAMTFGSSNVLVSWLDRVGGLAMGYMLSIMGAHIAYSVTDRPGSLTGMAAGALAVNGGSSSLGAVVGGFVMGYIVLDLKKLTIGVPRSLEEIGTLLLFPILGPALTSLVMLAIDSVAAPVNNTLTDFLSGLSSMNATLLRTVIGGMLMPGLGGSIDRATYLLSVATLATIDGETVPPVAMVSCGCSTMVIATNHAVTYALFPKKFSKNLRGAKIATYIMGLSFFIEGAIPFVVDRLKRILSSLCVRAAVAGALVAMFGTILSAPIGGLETLFLVNNIPLCLLLFVARTAVAVCMIYFFIRDEPD